MILHNRFYASDNLNRMTEYLHASHGSSIAYRKTSGSGPGIMFFPGFKSNMEGAKALATDAFCRENGISSLRFDYSGHGASSGIFEEGTIGLWLQDALAVFDAFSEGPMVLVGSSMGAWIALLLALKRPEGVAGMVGIAPAPDFMERLIVPFLKEEQHLALREKGYFMIPDCYGSAPYPITAKLLKDGKKHSLLNSTVPLRCPVRLLHGTNDADVPWQMSTALMEKLQSEDVTLRLIKGGDHRLSKEPELELLRQTLQETLRLAENFIKTTGQPTR